MKRSSSAPKRPASARLAHRDKESLAEDVTSLKRDLREAAEANAVLQVRNRQQEEMWQRQQRTMRKSGRWVGQGGDEGDGEGDAPQALDEDVAEMRRRLHAHRDASGNDDGDPGVMPLLDEEEKGELNAYVAEMMRLKALIARMRDQMVEEAAAQKRRQEKLAQRELRLKQEGEALRHHTADVRAANARLQQWNEALTASLNEMTEQAAQLRGEAHRGQQRAAEAEVLRSELVTATEAMALERAKRDAVEEHLAAAAAGVEERDHRLREVMGLMEHLEEYRRSNSDGDASLRKMVAAERERAQVAEEKLARLEEDQRVGMESFLEQHRALEKAHTELAQKCFELEKHYQGGGGAFAGTAAVDELSDEVPPKPLRQRTANDPAAVSVGFACGDIVAALNLARDTTVPVVLRALADGTVDDAEMAQVKEALASATDRVIAAMDTAQGACLEIITEARSDGKVSAAERRYVEAQLRAIRDTLECASEGFKEAVDEAMDSAMGRDEDDEQEGVPDASEDKGWLQKRRESKAADAILDLVGEAREKAMKKMGQVDAAVKLELQNHAADLHGVFRVLLRTVSDILKEATGVLASAITAAKEDGVVSTAEGSALAGRMWLYRNAVGHRLVRARNATLRVLARCGRVGGADDEGGKPPTSPEQLRRLVAEMDKARSLLLKRMVAAAEAIKKALDPMVPCTSNNLLPVVRQLAGVFDNWHESMAGIQVSVADWAAGPAARLLTSIRTREGALMGTIVAARVDAEALLQGLASGTVPTASAGSELESLVPVIRHVATVTAGGLAFIQDAVGDVVRQQQKHPNDARRQLSLDEWRAVRDGLRVAGEQLWTALEQLGGGVGAALERVPRDTLAGARGADGSLAEALKMAARELRAILNTVTSNVEVLIKQAAEISGAGILRKGFGSLLGSAPKLAPLTLFGADVVAPPPPVYPLTARWTGTEVVTADGSVLDASKATATSKLGGDGSAQVEYVISVKTGSKRGAGTNARAYVELFGYNNTSTGRLWVVSARGQFERNDLDEFSMTATNVGAIKVLRVGHDDSGLNSGWFLEYVQVRNASSGATWRFPCNRWLDRKEEDGAIERDLVADDASVVPGAGPTATGGANLLKYTVSVKTGDVRNAGTDAKVYIQLLGTTGETTGQLWLDGGRKQFERNDLDEFAISAPDVGNVHSIRIGHDNSGGRPGWFLDYVEVRNESSGATWRFPCTRWFDKEQDDGAIEREIVAEGSHGGPLTTYQVAVKTGDVRNAGTDARVYIQLFGSQGAPTGHIWLESAKKQFERNELDEFTITAPDVGIIQKLRIGHDNSGGRPGWFLDYVQVRNESSGTTWRFPCARWFDKEQDDGAVARDLISEGSHGGPLTTYQVAVKTGDVRNAGTDARVYVQLFGSQGGPTGQIWLESAKKQFERNDLDEFTITAPDVGVIQKLRVGHDNSGSGPGWFLDYVQIRNASSGATWRFPCARWLDKKEEDGAIERDLVPDVMPQGAAGTQGLSQPGVGGGPAGVAGAAGGPLTTYQVAVKTGDVRNAGTDARVYVQLFGSQGAPTGQIWLDSAKKQFERNDLDEFTITAPDVGVIRKLRVGHDNSGMGPGWFLEYVQVRNASSGNSWRFPCHRWLDKKEEDGVIERDLVPEVMPQGAAGQAAAAAAATTAMAAAPAAYPVQPVAAASGAYGQGAGGGCNALRKYVVSIKTGDVRNAGTDAKVYVQLFGSQAAPTGQIWLDATKKQFERNDLDEFTITAPNVGEIQKLRIGHDNSGMGPGWFLDYVQIRDASSGATWRFPCHRWLDKKEEDGAIERELVPA
eukprot:jgi/Mesvir1/23733/Mv18674-RA.1